MDGPDSLSAAGAGGTPRGSPAWRAATLVAFFLLAVGLAPIPGSHPLAVAQRDLQVAGSSWLSDRLPAEVALLRPPPAWRASDRDVAAAVEQAAGQRFRTHVRIIEQELDDDEVQHPRWRDAGAAAPGGGVERAWGVWSPEIDLPTAGTGSPTLRLAAVGRYRTGDATVLIDPAARPVRSAVLAHELAHALADQHGGVHGGHHLATEGFATMIEGRVVPGAGPARWHDQRPASHATYRELTTFWLPYVAAPLAFERIAQHGSAAAWAALRDPSGAAVLLPETWLRQVSADPAPDQGRVRALVPEAAEELLGVSELDPGHWVVLLGQYHALTAVRSVAAEITATTEFVFLTTSGRVCVTATVTATTPAVSRALAEALTDWVSADGSRAVVEGPDRALHVTGCDPGNDNSAQLDPVAVTIVADLIDALRGEAADPAGHQASAWSQAAPMRVSAVRSPNPGRGTTVGSGARGSPLTHPSACPHQPEYACAAKGLGRHQSR